MPQPRARARVHEVVCTRTSTDSFACAQATVGYSAATGAGAGDDGVGSGAGSSGMSWGNVVFVPGVSSAVRSDKRIAADVGPHHGIGGRRGGHSAWRRHPRRAAATAPNNGKVCRRRRQRHATRGSSRPSSRAQLASTRALRAFCASRTPNELDSALSRLPSEQRLTRSADYVVKVRMRGFRP